MAGRQVCWEGSELEACDGCAGLATWRRRVAAAEARGCEGGGTDARPCGKRGAQIMASQCRGARKSDGDVQSSRVQDAASCCEWSVWAVG